MLSTLKRFAAGTTTTPAAQNAMTNPLLNGIQAGAAGLPSIAKKIAEVDINKVAADAVALSTIAVARSIHAADTAVLAARDGISKVDVRAGLENAKARTGEVMGTVIPAAEKAGQWAKEHPGLVACGVVGIGLVAAPGLVTAPLLGAAGFGPGGVVSGSLAAGAQAGMGNVAAGSAFAFFQSAGAGGAALATVVGVVQGACVAVAAGAAAAKAAGIGGGDDSKPDERDKETNAKL